MQEALYDEHTNLKVRTRIRSLTKGDVSWSLLKELKDFGRNLSRLGA